MKKYQFTSEAVTEGHPDKICDQISDAILDAYLIEDSYSRCAVECMVTANQLIIAGEISSSVILKHEDIARHVIADIGYTEPSLGFHDGCKVLDLIHTQAPELTDNEGAGDQGIMFGYACKQTASLMPYPISIANQLAERLAEVRKKQIIKGLYPDGKVQVTCNYNNGSQITVNHVLISTHHDSRYQDDRLFKDLKKSIIQHVIHPIIHQSQFPAENQIFINPKGKWIENGGPSADTGLTGRKIITDTYGGWSRHGGGAFSGKDATKVDRSGAYMARYIAKTIVALNMATECEIQLSFIIGQITPVSVYANAFGTANEDDNQILEFIRKNFDLSVQGIIDCLELRKPVFRQTSNYGHFGREDFKWEVVDNAGER